jgi:DNA-binding response OmpR family regulator
VDDGKTRTERVSVYPPDFDPSEQQGEAPTTIFVSDPSAEADRLSAALHGEGYSVIDVPQSLLVARVAVQTPSLILLDIDAEGALDVVARLRELPGAQGIDILFLGDAGRTLSDSSDALRQEGSGFLARPIDVQALLRTIATLVGAKRAGDNPASSGSSIRPGPERSVPPPMRGARSPLPQSWSDTACARSTGHS